MTIITTRLIVTPEGSISLVDTVPPGEHVVRIVIEDRPSSKGLDYATFPRVDLGTWPEGLRLRREDMYGDDGR